MKGKATPSHGSLQMKVLRGLLAGAECGELVLVPIWDPVEPGEVVAAGDFFTYTTSGRYYRRAVVCEDLTVQTPSDVVARLMSGNLRLQRAERDLWWAIVHTCSQLDAIPAGTIVVTNSGTVRPDQRE
jgi:hypothetical protein